MLAVRRVVFLFACCGIFAGVFWDTIFEHIHGSGHNSGGSSEEDCPFIAAGIVSGNSGNEKARGGVPDIKKLLGEMKEVKLINDIDRASLPVMTQRGLYLEFVSKAEHSLHTV
mmetsp:Transcript_18631/g.22762  ORF Transcript_18631/g.22762 Transcript_18631/m.22762 type:complete len:113 (-) Transcript_18631:1902-2240(-)